MAAGATPRGRPGLCTHLLEISGNLLCLRSLGLEHGWGIATSVLMYVPSMLQRWLRPPHKNDLKRELERRFAGVLPARPP